MASGFEFLGPKNSDVNKKQSGTVSQDLTFDAGTKAALDKAVGSTDYSKSTAISDAKGAADYAIKKVLETGMPSVSSAAKSAGGYNSTTQEALTNDLSARAAGAGQQTLLDTIIKYAQAGASDIQAKTGAVVATAGKKQVTDMADNQQNRSAGALWDAFHPNQVAGGRYGGANSSSTPSGTVICTLMHKDGHITTEEYRADNRYVRNHFSIITVRGYRFWATPFVSLMQRNKVAYTIGKFIGVRWSRHMAAHYLPTAPRSITGFLFLHLGVPVCFCIGLFVSDKDFKHLWEGSSYRG